MTTAFTMFDGLEIGDRIEFFYWVSSNKPRKGELTRIGYDGRMQCLRKQTGYVVAGPLGVYGSTLERISRATGQANCRFLYMLVYWNKRAVCPEHWQEGINGQCPTCERQDLTRKPFPVAISSEKIVLNVVNGKMIPLRVMKGGPNPMVTGRILKSSSLIEAFERYHKYLARS